MKKCDFFTTAIMCVFAQQSFPDCEPVWALQGLGGQDHGIPPYSLVPLRGYGAAVLPTPYFDTARHDAGAALSGSSGRLSPLPAHSPPVTATPWPKRSSSGFPGSSGEGDAFLCPSVCFLTRYQRRRRDHLSGRRRPAPAQTCTARLTFEITAFCGKSQGTYPGRAGPHPPWWGL